MALLAGMARCGGLLAAFLAVPFSLSSLSMAQSPLLVTQAPGVTAVGIDTNSTGNGPRRVASVESCRSLAAGEAAEIDIVAPAPGIPWERGIAGYSFTIFYDPSIVWIGADDPNQLLAMAPGSSLVPISDPKPDWNGIYKSGATDFGSKGVEPAGTSESGIGVLARLTILPRRQGASPLILRDVAIADDASQRVDVRFILSGVIAVDQSCPERGQTPAPATASPTATAGGAPGSAAAPLPRFGGIPAESRSWDRWLLAWGLAAATGGALLIAGAARPGR